MNRDALTKRINICCEQLTPERLRRVAKVAYEELQHQQRAIAMQAWPESDDTPTAADPAEAGAEPTTQVFSPFKDVPA